MKTSEQPLQNRAIISFSVMLTAIMVLLDMTIANVSLPHMMGSLGVTSQQVTWVITSYSMAEAIFIPLASYFSQKFGIRKLILISIIGFIVTSALCGQATSLLQMILFRVMQGAFGASIIPLAQSTMIQIYPSSERGKVQCRGVIRTDFRPYGGRNHYSTHGLAMDFLCQCACGSILFMDVV